MTVTRYELRGYDIVEDQFGDLVQYDDLLTLEKERDLLKETLVSHDRLFSKSVVVLTEDYQAQIKERDALAKRLKVFDGCPSNEKIQSAIRSMSRDLNESLWSIPDVQPVMDWLDRIANRSKE